MPRLPDTLRQDVLYALRTMRKHPGFALTAVFTLALGIGANTAIFTVIRAVLLKPLNYSDPDRLVRVSGGATWTRFTEMKPAASSYTELGAYLGGPDNVTLSGNSGPEVRKAARVSFNFLRILGVEPLIGRGFLPEEDVPQGPRAAIVSEELWRSRFASDPLVTGKSITLSSADYTIVGVLPSGFQFPFSGVDVWITRPAENVRPLSPLLAIFGRLKPQATLTSATAELAVLDRRYAIAHPGMLDSKPHSPARVTPFKDALVAQVRSLLWTLFGAVSFVLLIACSNVASLLLARAAARSREFAVRAALGANRGRLIAQLLTESVLLSLAGGALGLLLATWGLKSIAHLTALNLPRISEIRLDPMVLAFAIAVSVCTGIVFGLVPSLGASRPDLAAALRTAGESAGTAVSKSYAISPRGLLVVGQVALSIVLLIGAALLMQTMVRLSGVNPGFNPGNLITMRISLPLARYGSDAKQTAFFDDLIQRVQTLPGVRSASMALTVPMDGGFPMTPVQPADQPLAPLNQRLLGVIQFTTPDYFQTLEIPLRRGRVFNPGDNSKSNPVVIVNETLARRFWPSYPKGTDAIGQSILLGSAPQPVRIVGIVADTRQSLDNEPMPSMFRPPAQTPSPALALIARTAGDPARFANSIRAQVLAIDPGQPVSNIGTMTDVIEAASGQRRLILLLLALFAGTAVLLTMTGIYGIVAYGAAQRTRELGIRRALGASDSQVLWLIVSQGLALTLGGVVVGIGCALALTRVIAALLFQVSATDTATFAVIALLLLFLALAASYIPARRATRLDPSAALRIG